MGIHSRLNRVVVGLDLAGAVSLIEEGTEDYVIITLSSDDVSEGDW